MSSTKVKVAVRVRPMNKRELDLGTHCVVDMLENQTVLDSISSKRTRKTFAFDHCFWSIDPNNPKFADQELVFKSLGTDVLDNAFAGYNACIFAYGQTGSGKSYTMMGVGGDDHLKGIIPRLCDTLFAKIAENKDQKVSFKVEVSYMEIYCEKVRDLLCPKGGKLVLKLREHKTLGPYVENLSKLAVTSFKDINELMSEGNKSRTVAATQMNTESSRSHAVFSILLSQTHFDPQSKMGTEKVAKISLVDLAGSERVSKTGLVGDRLKEGSNINKSLTTLGLVISALADISGGKKPKGSHIPYRDSTLTWLLKDNLGGNSKTVMVATVSPASDNYEETLSTLRYADRAKRIVNHAVVNEDPNSRIVRELREEVEKLQALLAGKLSGGGNAVSAKEMLELREKLRISEGLFSEMTKSWETKLAEANRIHQERQKALENMGISVQESGIGVQGDKFYLVNLNADPSMNELLVCYLKDVTRIGRASTEVPQDIQLRGLGIANEHCIVEIVGQDVFITPIKAARTLVNGHMASEKVQVRHGARILLGNNHLFRLNCPGGSGGQMDYDEAMKEISSNELKHDPMYVKMKDELIERHKAEKEGALEEQKQKYEEQLAKLKEQLETSNTTSPTPPTKPQPRVTTLEEEWEYRNRERLINTVLAANRLVQEANLLSEALNKDTLFKVTLTVPRSFLCPRQKVDTEEMHTSNEVAIRVLHKQRGTDSVWSLDALEEKVLTMREMYERLEDGGTLLDEEPFYDLEQHAFLGVANIFLECLQHECVSHEYDAPIVAPTGKVCGKLRLAIQRVPTMMADLRLEREGGDEVDMSGVLEVVDDGGELQPGSVFTCQVTVIEATGLPREYCHYVFCQYQFWSQEEAMIIPPLVQSVGEKLPDGVQRFDHCQTFTVEVTEDLLEFIQDGALSVEVWGHRRGFDLSIAANEEGEGGRPKSFPERWSELTRRLELWVEIMELSDQGEYVPVEIQTKQDVVTGGIFMIRQGQSRRISVVVQEVEGSGRSPLVCESISSISVGSIYLRNRYDEPLDSCQENDVERLRIKWSEALMNRRDYLDTEVRKLMEKREQSVSDLEKQNKLLDQWAVLQWQRAAVLQPKAGSGVPGAPTNWSVEPGVETSVPVLFLDMNDDLLTPSDDDPVGAVTTGSLFGEKPETMKELPIIKREEHAPRAMASWDSTIYDNNSLNKVTASNDRVYAILKVGVQLKHPPGIELVLRKRICLRVYKAMGIGTKLLRVFTGRESRTACGVMYEVVMGIPKQEGMQPPPKIPANPSFVELDEDENAVEKFKKAMSSISNILALDRLKQEVALKEKLASSGKVLRKRYAYGESPSLSRADSGLVYAGSRAETPEPSDDQSEPALVMSSFPPDEEEATTVGGAATSLQLNHVEEEGGELGPEPRVLEIEVDPVQRLDIIPEGGPALEVIPEEPGQAEDGSLPLTEDGSQPQTEDSSQPRTEDGGQPRTEDGSLPQDSSQSRTEDGSRPRTEDGSQPQTEDGSRPQTEDGSLPQTEDGSQPQTEDGSRPGTEDGSLPQTEDGSQPQTEDGSLPQTEDGSLPQTEDSSRPGTEDGSLPQTEDSSLPGTEDSSLPRTEDGSQPRTEDSSQPRTEDSSQPRTEDSSQPRTEDSSQPRTEDSSLLVTEQKQPLVASEGQGDISKAPKEDDTEESTRKESSKDERPIDSHEPRPEEPVTGPKEGSMESAGETIPLSKVPEVITTSSEGDIHHETLENQGRTKGRSSLDPRALEDDIVNLRRRSEGDVRVPVKHKPPHSPYSRSTTSSPLMNKKHDTTKRPHSPSHRRDSSPGRVKREPSPPSSGESENSSIVSESTATKVTTSLVVKERVVVDVAGSYKLGTIKYIGVTEFAAGEWVGVALDRPSGKHNGTVKGVKYFSCKDKHGIFVRREKIISTESSVSTPKSRNKSPSPLTGKKYVSNSAAYARPTYASSSKSSYSRRSSLGPGRKA